MSRAARSLFFCVTYLTHLLLVMGPVQWLLLGPWIRLRPGSRRSVLRAWQRSQGRWVLTLARVLADVRIAIAGVIPAESVIVVMNHQSLFDIPLAFELLSGPSPLIPVRRRYERAPVFSTLMRMAGHPFVDPGKPTRPEDRETLARALESVARREHSFLIFPEGHRSPEGSIRPFRTGGLRLAFERAPHHPVYVVLLEGLAHIRTFPDLALRIAGTRARATVMGPFAIPPDPAAHEAFIAGLRERMVERLGDARTPAGTEPAAARGAGAAG